MAASAGLRIQNAVMLKMMDLSRAKSGKTQLEEIMSQEGDSDFERATDIKETAIMSVIKKSMRDRVKRQKKLIG